MQINPFGFPLGNGLGTAPTAGAAQPGFAAVLGLAFGNGTGTPGFAAGAPLPGEQPVATIEQAPASMPAIADSLLPGLQTSTPLSQLMATAAKLPAAEMRAPALPAATEAPLLPAAPAPAAIAAPDTVPAKVASVAKQATSVAPVEAATSPSPTLPVVDAEAAPAEPETVAPEVALEPVTPRKPGRTAKDEVQDLVQDGAQPQADAAVQPTPIPAALVQQQPASQPQPQRAAARGETAPALGAPTRKGPASAAATAQPQQHTGTAPAHATSEFSFERAVAAADTGTPSDGSQQQHDGQAPELKLAATAARHDAPAMPQHVQHAAASSTPAAAPAEPVLTARAGQLGQSLGVEVARKVEAGEETLRVRLSPEHLGKIEVTLAFDDGKLHATVRAESAHALELLRQDAGDLARTLDQAGIRTDAQSFRFEARADGGNGQAASQQQNSNRGGQHQQHAHHDDLEPAPAYRSIRGDGQVDLLA